MNHFHRNNGELHCEDVALAQIAADVGTPVYVWTVDDRARVEQLARWEADGIITNDPRVFSGLTT